MSAAPLRPGRTTTRSPACFLPATMRVRSCGIAFGGVYRPRRGTETPVSIPVAATPTASLHFDTASRVRTTMACLCAADAAAAAAASAGLPP